MKITILTLFKDMYDGFLNTSIIKRIIKKGLIEIEVVDIRDYSTDKHRHVDDTPYGGGAGMLMKVDVLARALADVKGKDGYVLLTSPKAKPFKQEDARRLLKKDHIVIVCGHYEGIDYRFEKYCNEKISIGDYVLTGGELPSMVVTDCIARLIEDGISSKSLDVESYDNGLLECPQYTRPYDFNGDRVPDVLLGGNHEEIRRYNLKMALRETVLFRDDLLRNRKLSEEEISLLEELFGE